MSLGHAQARGPHHGFPRVSGDEPSSLVISLMVWVFSPRERG